MGVGLDSRHPCPSFPGKRQSGTVRTPGAWSCSCLGTWCVTAAKLVSSGDIVLLMLGRLLWGHSGDICREFRQPWKVCLGPSFGEAGVGWDGVGGGGEGGGGAVPGEGGDTQYPARGCCLGAKLSSQWSASATCCWPGGGVGPGYHLPPPSPHGASPWARDDRNVNLFTPGPACWLPTDFLPEGKQGI